MANKHQSEGFKQDEHAWYRESRRCADQLFDAFDFGNALVWDPAAGTGNILDAAKARGHPTIASDIIDRMPKHKFYRSNFLMATKWPTPPDGRPLAIVTNPPFNVPPGAAESFMLKALDVVPFWRAAFIVPIEFLCGQGRYRRLFSQRKPSHVGYFVERPSMPPGAQVEALGDKAFKGGKADFCCIVFTAGGPYRTESVWIDPEPPTPPSLGRTRPGSRSPSVSAASRKD